MGNTQAIYQAAKDGNLRRLQMWIRRYPKCTIAVLVNLRTELGMTPLTVACRNGHVDVVEYLLDNCGALIDRCVRIYDDDDHGSAVDGPRSLWWAIKEGHLGVVRSLLTRGADVNCPSRRCFDHLMQACIQGDIQMVKYLVANGAVVKIPRANRSSALNCACQRGHYQIICYLIRNGADLSVEGNTALRSCISISNLRCLKLLLRYGAEVDRILDEMRPLLYIRRSERPQQMEYLLFLPLFPRYPLAVIESLGLSCVDMSRRRPYTLPNWRRRLEKDQVNGHRVVRVRLNHADERRMDILRITKGVVGPVHRSETYSFYFRWDTMYSWVHSGQQTNVSMWKMLASMHRLCSDPVHHLVYQNVRSFPTLFADQVAQNGPLAYELVLVVFVATVKDFEASRLNQIDGHDGLPPTLILFAAVNLTYTLVQLKQDMSEGHRRLFDDSVAEFIGLEPRLGDGWTPLHLMAHRLPDRHPPLMPNVILEAIKLLLDRGADPSAVNEVGNGPLHVVAMATPVKYDVIDLLIDRGAHFDARNVHRQRFIELLPPSERHRYRPCDHLSLKCLAATAMVDHAVPRELIGVPALIRFVNLH